MGRFMWVPNAKADIWTQNHLDPYDPNAPNWPAPDYADVDITQLRPLWAMDLSQLNHNFFSNDSAMRAILPGYLRFDNSITFHNGTFSNMCWIEGLPCPHGLLGLQPYMDGPDIAFWNALLIWYPSWPWNF